MRANSYLLMHSCLDELMAVAARNVYLIHVCAELTYNDTLVVYYIVFITYKANNLLGMSGAFLWQDFSQFS
jgi:hypothetical protein